MSSEGRAEGASGKGGRGGGRVRRAWRLWRPPWRPGGRWSPGRSDGEGREARRRSQRSGGRTAGRTRVPSHTGASVQGRDPAFWPVSHPPGNRLLAHPGSRSPLISDLSEPGTLGPTRTGGSASSPWPGRRPLWLKEAECWPGGLSPAFQLPARAGVWASALGRSPRYQEASAAPAAE